jgi:signal peptidase I
MTALTLTTTPRGTDTADSQGAANALVAPQAVTRWIRWVGKALVNLSLLAAVLMFLGLAVGPHLFQYRTMTMLTGSMAPLINPGDVTIVTPLAASEVKPGMIISYHIPVEDHRVVSHRVVDVTHGPAGAVTVQTKGDANPGNDPWTATLQGNTAYQVRGVVPALGTAIRFLRTPVLQKALLYGVPALLAGWFLLSLWAPRKTEDPA